MKRTASAVVLGAAVLLGPVTWAGTASAAPFYPNCEAAHAVGVSNIHRGQPGYRPALDHDHDGVACEASGGASGGHGSVVSPPSTHSPSSTTGSSGSSGSSAAQVAVVPQGGAETGDGSTEGHPGWWVGGALLAGIATLVPAWRMRVRRGR